MITIALVSYVAPAGSGVMRCTAASWPHLSLTFRGRPGAAHLPGAAAASVPGLTLA
jgi:hypothetical protein